MITKPGDFDDPQIREAMERMQVGVEEAKGFASAVTSLQIFALK